MDAQMNVLILGGAGFLGSNLTRYCLEQGAEVTVIDSLEEQLHATTDNLPLDEIEFVHEDMAYLDQTGHEYVKWADVIFNCAAQSSHPLSMMNPFYDVSLNCIAVLSVLQAVKIFSPETPVIYTSSTTTVGSRYGVIHNETYPEHPLDIYSANKLVAEKYHHIYNKAYGLKTVCLRFPNLYGPYGKGYPQFGFINYFISLAKEGKDIPIFGMGMQARNVMYVEDTCSALWRTYDVREKLQDDLYFATSNVTAPVLFVALKIQEVFGGSVVHMPWPKEREAIEIGGVQYHSKRFQRETKWSPKYDLDEGLRKTCEFS
tara:strand:- start:4452 stop:5399 length:948 start_codon:yes stop_codon:yes gene_type:complete